MIKKNKSAWVVLQTVIKRLDFQKYELKFGSYWNQTLRRRIYRTSEKSID